MFGPGQYFTDEYGRPWHFANRSGSKDPMNVFRGAAGGIVLTRLMCLDEAQINPIDHRV